MAVIAKLLDGDKTAAKELADNQEKYHIALAGMYGFYYIKVAENDTQFENALSLMLVATKGD